MSLSRSKTHRAVVDDEEATNLEDDIEGSDVVDVGTHVYCRFTNGQYYWGFVAEVARGGKRSRQYVYSIDFHDGDKLSRVARSDFITEERYHALGLTENPPPKLKERKEKSSGDDRKRTEHETKATPSKRRKGSENESRDGVKCYSLRELFTKRCAVCPMCLRDDCGKCVACLRNKESRSNGRECCLQKMCSEIPVESKAQPAVGFPQKWRFYFGDTFQYDEVHYRKRSNPNVVPGLRILHPTNENYAYRSIESAFKRHGQELLGSNLDRDTIRETFYKHIGVDLVRMGDDKEEHDSMDDGIGYNLRELYRYRCKSCDFCLRSECGVCAPCIRNEAMSPIHRECCMRKMCCNIPLKKKAQPGCGMPTGWRFALCKGRAGTEESACNLVLLSPSGETFSSLEAARNGPVAFEISTDVFYETIGARDSINGLDHALIGKNYYQQWVDVHGARKEIFGTISMHEPGEKKEFTVTYSSTSRKIANSFRNECGCMVPETGRVCFEQALGGCMMYDKIKDKISLATEVRSRHYYTWIVPDVRQETVLDAEDGTRLPHLTVTLRGFKLDFSVKKSSVENQNAGHGVFMRCEALDIFGDETELVLEPGTLVDLGVCSPLRANDRRPCITFLMKNFIHSLQCQAYAWESSDSEYIFDITDDVTGNLHALAREKVLPHVNECSSDEKPIISATHDPEGSVHYMLGFRNEKEGKLVIPANGLDVEVFIDYGTTYEDVRVRASYSRLTGEDLVRSQSRLEKEDLACIYAVDEFSLQDVDLCVNYFCGVVSGEENLTQDPTVIRRATLAAVLLTKRAQKKFFDFQEDMLGSEDNVVTEKDIHEVLKKSRRLTILLLNQMADSRSQYHELFNENDLSRLEKKLVEDLGLTSVENESGSA